SDLLTFAAALLITVCPLWYNDLHREDLNNLVFLVANLTLYRSHSAVGFRTRRSDRYDLALHSENVAGPSWSSPIQFTSGSNYSACDRQTTGHEQTHHHGSSVPTTYSQSTEHALFSRL